MFDYFLFNNDYIYNINLKYINHTEIVDIKGIAKWDVYDNWTFFLESHGVKYELNIVIKRNSKNKTFSVETFTESVEKFYPHISLSVNDDKYYVKHYYYEVNKRIEFKRDYDWLYNKEQMVTEFFIIDIKPDCYKRAKFCFIKQFNDIGYNEMLNRLNLKEQVISERTKYEIIKDNLK